MTTTLIHDCILFVMSHAAATAPRPSIIGSPFPIDRTASMMLVKAPDNSGVIVFRSIIINNSHDADASYGQHLHQRVLVRYQSVAYVQRRGVHDGCDYGRDCTEQLEPETCKTDQQQQHSEGHPYFLVSCHFALPLFRSCAFAPQDRCVACEHDIFLVPSFSCPAVHHILMTFPYGLPYLFSVS